MTQVRQPLPPAGHYSPVVWHGDTACVSGRVYITDIGNGTEFDAQYTAWIGDHRPAPAVVEVRGLHYGTAVEIEAIAARAG